MKIGFITINQNCKSGIPYVQQADPRSQVRGDTFLFSGLCNARLWKQQNRSHSRACCSSQESLTVKILPQHLPAPAFGGSDLELKWCGCSLSLLCLTSWLPIHPSSLWPSESSPSPWHRECYPCHLEQHFCCSKPKLI